MPLAIDTMDDLDVGDKVYMFSTDFPATVLETNAYSYTVKVRDEINSNVHYIALPRLLKAASYEVGETYIDGDGNYFVFKADREADAWEKSDGSYGFDYPSRPLRKVLYGPALSD